MTATLRGDYNVEGIRPAAWLGDRRALKHYAEDMIAKGA
jgi:hypothetical protein